MSSSQHFLAEATDYANRAIEADNKQDYKNALKWYHRAVEYLLAARKFEKNPHTIAYLDEKAPEYVDRAEVLKEIIRNQNERNANGGMGVLK